MKNIVKHSFTLLAFLVGLGSYAQQNTKLNNYMFSKMNFNPAYAGHDGGLSVGLLNRNQWTSHKGQPNTQLLNVQYKQNSIGMGANLNHDQIGKTKHFQLGLNGAYYLPLSTGQLAMGLKAGFRYSKTNELVLNQDQDVTFQENYKSVFTPQFGAGVFYTVSGVELAVSSPDLVQLANGAGDNDSKHITVMGSYQLELNSSIDYHPYVFVKTYSKSTQEVTFTNMLEFNKAYRVGVSYTHKQSMSILANVGIKDQLDIGFAMDFYSLKGIGVYNGMEVLVRYFIIPKPMQGYGVKSYHKSQKHKNKTQKKPKS